MARQATDGSTMRCMRCACRATTARIQTHTLRICNTCFCRAEMGTRTRFNVYCLVTLLQCQFNDDSLPSKHDGVDGFRPCILIVVLLLSMYS